MGILRSECHRENFNVVIDLEEKNNTVKGIDYSGNNLQWDF